MKDELFIDDNDKPSDLLLDLPVEEIDRLYEEIFGTTKEVNIN